MDIDWKDMKLSGEKLGEGHYGEVHLGKIKFEDKWLKAAVKSLKGKFECCKEGFHVTSSR